MNDRHFQRRKSIFEGALEQPAALRSAFLGQECGGDAALRREVEELLAAHGQAGAFLEEPAALPVTVPLTGRRVGSYRILDEIGRGGMGRVYRAVRDDDSFQRQVAVKVAAGDLGSETGAARFLRERQILARLQHPNIATLHDGGATEEGQAYLVMELVEGEPLDAYCAARHLAVRERLALFRTVCDAVHYAHQNLVVHRDLKPSNILVTPAGTPKLLDFGISKLLSPDTEVDSLPTATILPVLTPEYASPEQVRGEPVTTASDVYSLGVVLYELLTGGRPYAIQTRSPEEVLRVVCRVEPARPSTAARRTGSPLSSALEGDLDTIVLKCLRKEAARRYGSARELADDIGNYLEGRPVLARPDSATYRASKFVRRHRAAVVATSLASLALVATTVVALVQAREARLARARAERRFQDVRRLANSVIFELHDGIERLPGSTAVRELLVKRALEYLDDLGSEDPDDPRLQSELAEAYQKIGDVQGGSATLNLGHRAEALASYRRALALRQQLAARFPDDPGQQRALSALHGRLGSLSTWNSDFGAAAASYTLQLEAARNLLRLRPGDAISRRAEAIALANLGQARCNGGDLERGLPDSRQAIALFEELVREDSPALRQAGYDVADNLATIRMMLGESLLAATDRPGDALAALTPALAFREAQLRAAPLNAEAKGNLAFLLATVGDAQQRIGALAAAEASYRRAAALCEELLAADRADAESRITWLGIQVQWGELELKAGRTAAAERRLRRTLDDLRSNLATPTEDNRSLKMEALAQHALGRALEARRAGSLDACAHHLRAHEAWRAALGDRPLTKFDGGTAERMRAAADRCRAKAAAQPRS
jgi:non-specific serine/threonine protein kinase/serine/threonine-protein kinase